MGQLTLAGRTDVGDDFRLFDVCEWDRLTHSPRLVFHGTDDGVTVELVERPLSLLALPDETPLMGQWHGEWSSDDGQFTVGQRRQAFEAQDAPFKGARNVVKLWESKGDFRMLTCAYDDVSGIPCRASNHSKTDGERLERFFRQHDIPVETHHPPVGYQPGDPFGG
jgi:hypothetical protein